MQTEHEAKGEAEQLKCLIEEGTETFDPDNFINAKTSQVDVARLKQKITAAKKWAKHSVQGKPAAHVQRRESKPYAGNAHPLCNAGIAYRSKNKSHMMVDYVSPQNHNSIEQSHAVHFQAKDSYEHSLEAQSKKGDSQKGGRFNQKLSRKSREFMSSNVIKAGNGYRLPSNEKDAASALRYYAPKTNSRNQNIIINSKNVREKQRRKKLATDLCHYETPHQNMAKFGYAQSTEDTQLLRYRNGIDCKRESENGGNRQNTEHISRMANVSAKNNMIKKRCMTKLQNVDDQNRCYDKGSAHCARSKVSLKDSSVNSLQNAECRRILIDTPQKLQEFELRVISLWDLYRDLYLLTEEIARTGSIAEETITNYVRNVSSEKFEFINEICCVVAESRALMSIKLSRILENFAIFGICLNSLNCKQMREAESINFLGYSSSSLIFLIKILFLCYDCDFAYSEAVESIHTSIVEFEEQSYKTHFRNVRELIRNIEHNNEIIKIIKKVCGNKSGKYVEEYINDTIKEYTGQNYECRHMDFYRCARGIFEFLSFILHLENMPFRLPLLATPPTPFLQLQHPKTIVIEPWGVLAYLKRGKLVVRANTHAFLDKIINRDNDSLRRDRLPINEQFLSPSAQQLSWRQTDIAEAGLNIIFWTQLMPKQAEVLTSLLPQGENIHWLYRYHCRHEKSHTSIQQPKLKSKSKSPNKHDDFSHAYLRLRNKHFQSEHHRNLGSTFISRIKILQNAGCIEENTIIIDNDSEAYKYHSDVGVEMKWKGEKKDIKLLRLSEILETVLQSSERNSTTLKDELRKREAEISQLTHKGRQNRDQKL